MGRKRSPVSIVLSGGGVRGAYQVGVLRYLSEQDYPVEIVSGTSVGALNGALFAQDRNTSRLEAIWRGLKSIRSLGRLWLGFPFQQFYNNSLLNPGRLKGIIARNIDPDKLARSPIRYFCCSTNLNTGKKVFMEGNRSNASLIQRYLYASAAFPIGFPPEEIYGQQYLDGGIRENVPLSVAVQHAKNSKDFIVVVVSGMYKARHHLFRNIVKMALHVVSLVLDEGREGDLAVAYKLLPDNARVRLLEIEDSIFDSLFDVDPDKIAAAIEAGYSAARDQLGRKA